MAVVMKCPCLTAPPSDRTEAAEEEGTNLLGIISQTSHCSPIVVVRTLLLGKVCTPFQTSY